MQRTTRTQTPAPTHRRGWLQRESTLGVLLLLPALALIVAVILRPLLDSLWLSFFEQDLLAGGDTTWVGLGNYAWLFGEGWFPATLLRTFIVALVVVNLQLWIAFGLALLLEFDFPGRTVLRALLITPWAVPVIVAAFIWSWMYDPSFGPINAALQTLGIIKQPIVFLGTRQTALIAVMIALTWKGLPFMLLAMIAGLQQVPPELREAARVDGANGWHEFRWVILPGMRNVILLMLILRGIFLFNHFDFIYLLTGGGPSDASTVMSLKAVSMGLESFRFDRAATITAFMFVLLAAMSVLYFRVSKFGRGGGE